jgi:hypothetical protein
MWKRVACAAQTDSGCRVLMMFCGCGLMTGILLVAFWKTVLSAVSLEIRLSASGTNQISMSGPQ